MTESVLKRTALYTAHQDLGAKLVPFAGFEMPVQYSGIIDEHLAVRTAAGLFDVSHMGEVRVTGSDALSFVQNLVTNDATALYDGKAMYAVMCRPDGTAVDDLLVYRESEERYMLVINASNIEKDFAWMIQNNPMNAHLENISDSVSLLAIQGPRSLDIAARVLDTDVHSLKYYHFAETESSSFFGSSFGIISRTGYTGEPGLELYCDNSAAEKIWNALLEAGEDAGIKPAGLGARDTLRLESGFCLYGNDLTDNETPLEAGLGWITKLDTQFVGRDALAKQKENGIGKRLVSFVLQDRGIPRQGYPILNQSGDEIGMVTSGTQSPILKTGIGMGYVQNSPEFAQPGSPIFIGVRNKRLAAEVRKPPLHK